MSLDPCPVVSTGPPSVSGGMRTIAAKTEDLRRVARTFDRAGDDARAAAAQVVALPMRLPPLGVVAPGASAEVLQQVGALTLGPSGIGAVALRLEVTARALRASATAYDTVEAATAQMWATTQIAVAPLMIAHTASTVVTRAVGGALLEDPLSFLMANKDLSALDRSGALLQKHFGQEGTRALYANPGLPASVLALRGPLVPYEQGSALLLRAAQVGGFGTDRGRMVVTEVPLAAAGTPRQPASGPTRPPHPPTAPPRDVAGLLDRMTDVAAPAATRDGTRVRAQRIQGADGRFRWVVSIPGTQNWSPRDGANPADLFANLALASGGRPKMLDAYGDAIARAMRAEGVSPGSEPVMLTGHSQGGLVATRMAADPLLRRRLAVTTVVTAGSPTSRMTPERRVSVLSLEHRHDPVPRLDQRDEAREPNRVRVEMDERQQAGRVPPTVGATGPGCTTDPPMDQHHSSRYAMSAQQQVTPDSADPQIRAFYRDNDGFLNGTVVSTRDYQIRREGAG